MFLTRSQDLFFHSGANFLLWSVSFSGSITFRHVKTSFFLRTRERERKRERGEGGMRHNRKNKISRMPNAVRLMLARCILVSLGSCIPFAAAMRSSSLVSAPLNASLRAFALKRKSGVAACRLPFRGRSERRNLIEYFWANCN